MSTNISLLCVKNVIMLSTSVHISVKAEATKLLTIIKCSYTSYMAQFQIIPATYICSKLHIYRYIQII